jgi:hypothetical protein
MRRPVIGIAVIAGSLVLFGVTPTASQATPSTPNAAPAASSPVMRWKLAVDLRARPNRNRFPSYRGGAAVWSLRASQSLKRDGNYRLLPTYSPTFGSAGISAWHGSTPKCVRLPAIGVNTTNTLRPLCTGAVPALAAFVRPDATHMPVVAWTSPFDGAVSISHDAISDLDRSCGDGVSYYVDLGTTQLATTTITNGGGIVLPEVTLQIEPGQSLYFIVDPGPSNNIGCDTTQLQVTIDQITPNGEPEPGGEPTP